MNCFVTTLAEEIGIAQAGAEWSPQSWATLPWDTARIAASTVIKILYETSKIELFCYNPAEGEGILPAEAG
jgi:hypothetical protein